MSKRRSTYPFGSPVLGAAPFMKMMGIVSTLMGEVNNEILK